MTTKSFASKDMLPNKKYRMHIKYFDVLEYYRESREAKPVGDTVAEFQRFA